MAVDIRCPRKDCKSNQNGSCQRGWVELEAMPIMFTYPKFEIKPALFICNGFEERDNNHAS